MTTLETDSIILEIALKEAITILTENKLNYPVNYLFDIAINYLKEHPEYKRSYSDLLKSNG